MQGILVMLQTQVLKFIMTSDLQNQIKNTYSVKFKLDPGWHTYWKNPGDSGEKTSFEWTLPDGFKIDGPFWPQPEKIPHPPLMTFGYNDEVIVFFKLFFWKN